MYPITEIIRVQQLEIRLHISMWDISGTVPTLEFEINDTHQRVICDVSTAPKLTEFGTKRSK